MPLNHYRIGTANFYTEGTSEQLLGEFLKGKRDNFVVATKYTLNRKSLIANCPAN